ncbi:MAG: hypothetical protein M9924_00790 [Rhizobiaceae bacterium]|nr:hypothetical protein [Rhizobiaceae bacterium]
MAENIQGILGKVGAVVLTGAAILGVAYSGAKYIAAFEAAQAEIQNLRGQVAQLQDLLSKAQTSWDPARLERLEKQVAELSVRVDSASQIGGHAAETHASIEDHLRAGGFGGTATDTKTVWPFRVTNLTMTPDFQFEGEIEWVTLKATHRIRGNFSDKNLYFKEVEIIKQGNNVIGCEYSLNEIQQDGMAGSYQNCDGGATGGTVSLKWW